MSTLLLDLKYGLRMLARTPVVSTVAALSLALGIASNASMFAILDGFLFSPMPYPDQDELVVLREARPGENMDLAAGVSIPNFRDYAAASTSFESATAYTTETANLSGRDVPERVTVAVATPSLFDVLEARPEFGRGFLPEEGAEGRGNVLVLHHAFWQRAFFGRRDALGQTLMLDGQPFTVIGVMPEAFDMVPADVQAIRPSDFSDQEEQRGANQYLAFARLGPGASVEVAQQELAGVSSRLQAEYPDAKRGRDLRLMSISEFFPGTTDRQLVKILTFVTLFGLLIACANVANLLLGRAEGRQKEMAVRTALGAGRVRILRQLLTESVTLGLIAGVVGVGLAYYVVAWLQGVMPPQMPRSMVPVLSLPVVAVSVGVALAAGLLFGLAPAAHAARGDLRESLGEGSRGGTVGRSRKRLRNIFVIGEFAAALALLTGAGFMIQAFERLTGDDPGFRADHLLTFEINALDGRYDEPEALAAYQRDLEAVLADVVGVEGVALMSSLPRGQFSPGTRYTVDGRPELAPEEQARASLQVVNPGYFSAMEIPLLAGRLFDPSDDLASQPVVVVSRALAEREFPGEVAIGRTLHLRDDTRVIVGVVSDILQDRIALAGNGGEALYVPNGQAPRASVAFALRTVGEPNALAPDVRRAVWSVEADQPVAALRSLDEHVAESLAGPRAIQLFLVVLASIAVILAALGIYGVLAHAVAQQRREIGIRMALGAGRGNVVRMVTRTGLGLAGTGLAAGLPLAWLMYTGVRNALNLFETDLGLGYPLAIASSLVAAAVLATWLPARRATGVSPASALRD